MSKEFGVSNATVYSWFHGGTPYGKRAGRITMGRNLFYVIGALLGDGNIYFWRNSHQIWLLGEREFASKFATKISSCLNRNVPFYPYRGRNVWFVKLHNAELFFLMKKIRGDPTTLMHLINEGAPNSNALEFVEGSSTPKDALRLSKGQRDKLQRYVST